MTEQALSDVKVLDLTWHIAGPYCTKLLADYGADVIKIEKPEGGDPARGMGPFPDDVPHPEKSGLFLNINTNKRGITLNLKTEVGKNIFKQLVKDVDILVENFHPGVMEKLGLDYETLEKINPRLVMTSISNFGQTGPYRDFKVTELVMGGMGDAMYWCGIPTKEPLKLAETTVQHATGITAAVETMGAFYCARYKGIGQYLDFSIMEAWNNGMERKIPALMGYIYTGDINGRRDPRLAPGLAGGVFPCKDGYFEIAGGLTYMPRVLKMIGEPEALKDPKWLTQEVQIDPKYRDEFDPIWLGFLLEHTKLECWEAGQAAKNLCAPTYNSEDLFEDPYINERGFFTEIEHPVAGKLKYPGRPFIMHETPWQVRRPAPLLGQHNEEVYGELGYTKQDLIRLMERGAI